MSAELSTVHQVVIGAAPGDAITSMALRMRRALRDCGCTSDIYARFIAPEMTQEVLPLSDLAVGEQRGLVIYHASYGVPDVTRRLLELRSPLVLVYHNITPWELLLDAQPDTAAGLRWGREELLLIRDRVVLSVAVSDFNRRDLEQYGYTGVEVIPVGLDPRRLVHLAPDIGTAHFLAAHCPNGYVLSVAQQLPHKRTELLLEAMHLVQWILDSGLGVVIVGPERMEAYSWALRELARRLNIHHVWFAGALSDAGLAACYRGAASFATVSAHEGLALPPIEAMAFDVPVVATANGALAETIGDAGLLLPGDAGPALVAEAIDSVATDAVLRSALVERGRRRVEGFTCHDPSDVFLRVLLDSRVA